MGRNFCRRWCPCFFCFRATFTPHHDIPLQPLPKPKPAEEIDGVPYIDSDKDPDILIIRNVDPCIGINGPQHHTSRYELMNRKIEPQLVVRRGQIFRLEITLSRPYDEDKDGISFIFTTEDEEKPSYGNGTLVAVPLLKKLDPYLSWNVILEYTYETIMKIQVIPSADSIVGKWRMDIDTKLIRDGAYSYSWPTTIYMLFNPWFRSDQTYLKSEDWRDETVLAEDGLIWRGTANQLRPVIWKFDQFEKDVLDCALYVIHVVGNVKTNAGADPVKISRAIAASVNSADDYGVVMGNWSDDMGSGTHPVKWLGSKEIIQKYYKNKKPVKYGQCWVFAGVLTTICRTLGIPCRPVTNYSSAHDTQHSLTVDYFVDEKGTQVTKLNSDSIWNFHVWNEVWMRRPDLGREYNGWQAIDSTPQELSDNMYRVGPAPVSAVKNGEILRPYDCGFLFAEVNADKVFWKYIGDTQPLKLLRKDIFGIGKLIITKTPGRFEKEDITNIYKYPEKSSEERITMLKALKQSENLFSRYYLNEEFNDIYFHFELRDDIKIGEPFDVILSMKNRSHTKSYQVSVILRVDVVTYTGIIGDSIKNELFNVSVKSNETSEAKLTVTYNEYAKKLMSQCAFNISCLACVEDTQFEYYAQDDFRIRKPDIKIVLLDKAIELTDVSAAISLENPLPITIKKGEFTIQGPGIENKIRIKVRQYIPPGEKVEAQFKFKPPKSGKYTIAAKFDSKELDDVDGYLAIHVEPNNELNNI